ncbi:hypothetical protein EIJ81_00370 (plasmid) [Aliivibrio salmonicida]|uniref:hypothetical protein n=1 Tax=Aliivibrio salmonicida TaxID=40269 RepID=UPI000F6DC231|nr:hypothetical protein [Aliivibrio salmonicida]AZL83354.1 hypothetical protein EIJ81_00370 [Aliivibrio salmonicida]
MIDWVYSRADLAKLIIDNMKANLFDRVTIFAPRKRGKTKFVQHDVIPLALKAGVLPIYVDFWLFENEPERSFIYGVNESINAYAPTVEKIKTIKLSSFEISAFWLKMKAEGRPDTLNDFEDCIQKLNSVDMPVLLLLDEVQHLGTRKEFMSFTKALRSFMTARADNKIKGLFTGSNQNDLKRLFQDTKAPFFESSSAIPFKELDGEFVTYQLANFKKATNGLEVDTNRAQAFFEEHHCKPEPLTDLLRKMAAYRVHDIDYALDFLAIDFSNGLFQETDLLKRSESDLAVMYFIAIGQNDNLFSNRTIEKLEIFGFGKDKSITISELNNAKNRLLKDNLIINPSRGDYHLESPELEAVVLNAYKLREER